MFNNIVDLLDYAAKAYRDRPVYFDGSSEGGSISFEELNRASLSVGTAIAGFISSQATKDITTKIPISVMTGRHFYTPACFLGIARAGCFYAPMDIELPISRLVQILTISNSPYLIVDRDGLEKAEEVLSRLGETDGASVPTVLILDELLETAPDMNILENIKSSINELTPLYMIFTSGSTGTPKGVLTGHYALMCYLDALNEVINLGEDDVLGNQSPLDYIAAVRDMYLPLLTGCSTVIIPRNITAMPEDLFRTLNEHRVTTLCWSASGLEVLAKLGAFNDDDIELPKYIRRIVFSGSVMSGRYLKMWMDAIPTARFINQYGPTETTASCTYYEVPEDVTEETALSIGKPYKHYNVFLLNDDEEVPKGEVGEICVSGPALAIGYYNSPDQTSKVFMRNPIIKEYEERIYRTGDLGRFAEDGNLEFLGRKDRQIKHMGHRIELAEIESSAMTLSEISQAISMYDPEKSMLYLFYTGEASPKDITIHFRANMPAFMVPRKLIQLDEFPLLHNGKIDMPLLKSMMK